MAAVARQKTITSMFRPYPEPERNKIEKQQAAAADGGGQSLLTKFFISSKPESNRFQYLFEREEAARLKREEEERAKRRRERELARKHRRKLRIRDEWKAKVQFVIDQRQRRYEERMKHQGRHIIDGVYLGSRHGARNAEWLFTHVDAVVNVSTSLKNYFEDGQHAVEEEPTLDALEDEDANNPIDEGVAAILGEDDVAAEPEELEDAMDEDTEEDADEDDAPVDEEDPDMKLWPEIDEEIQGLKVELERQENAGELECPPTGLSTHQRESLEYLRIGVADALSENLAAHFDSAGSYISSRVKRGQSVFVHCREGLSRSPSIVIAYLVKHRGMSLKDSYRFVWNNNLRKLRINDSFKRQLMEYEVLCSGTSSIDFFASRSLRRSGTENVMSEKERRKQLQERRAEKEKCMDVEDGHALDKIEYSADSVPPSETAQPDKSTETTERRRLSSPTQEECAALGGTTSGSDNVERLGATDLDAAATANDMDVEEEPTGTGASQSKASDSLGVEQERPKVLKGAEAKTAWASLFGRKRQRE